MLDTIDRVVIQNDTDQINQMVNNLAGRTNELDDKIALKALVVACRRLENTARLILREDYGVKRVIL